MGKYIRKSKTTGDIAVMEVSQPQSSHGVCTRAMTLALRSAAANTSASANADASESYLQLRSRRLLKPPVPALSKRQKSNPRARGSAREEGEEGAKEAEKLGEEEIKSSEKKRKKKKDGVDHDEEDGGALDLGIETSFGENVLDLESKERSTRESTPCNLIRDPETVKTPSSTTKPARSADTGRRIQNSTLAQVPSAHEIDEFLAGFEKEQQRKFMEKYNFDPVNEKPLPGRYQWEKVDP